MKHNRFIAALAMAGGVFSFGSAHAFAPLVAAGVASIVGAGVGHAQNESDQAKAEAAATAAIPAPPTVVLGGPAAVVQEGIPAPRDGFHWQQGHFEINNGVSMWMPGHWIAND